MSVKKIAFIGGTGPEGIGLALRMASVGHRVLIGSRTQERGKEVSERILAEVPDANVYGGTNQEVVNDVDVVFLTFPYSGQEATLKTLVDDLNNVIVCNVVAPLEFVKGIGAVAQDVPGNSAAEEAAVQLPDSRVVAAFQNMSAEKLMKLGEPVESDVLVCSDDHEAKGVVIELANQIDGVRGLDGGALSNSRYVEMLTSLLINLNRLHKTQTSIQVVGI
jgi:NADPH-dependent F420 reductase